MMYQFYELVCRRKVKGEFYYIKIRQVPDLVVFDRVESGSDIFLDGRIRIWFCSQESDPGLLHWDPQPWYLSVLKAYVINFCSHLSIFIC